jgi:hypothetical protein
MEKRVPFCDFTERRTRRPAMPSYDAECDHRAFVAFERCSARPSSRNPLIARTETAPNSVEKKGPNNLGKLHKYKN